jgi:hypothetical protein
MGSVDPLPYWQVNVPEGERTAECPEFLRELSEKDRGIIGTRDVEFRVLTWAEVRRIIADNRIDLFQRVPSDLRRYLAYNWALRRDFGSVMNFVLSQRLCWDAPIVPTGSRPFEHDGDGDVKILYNDWPYGIDERIVHLVVWTKFDLEEDPATGDLTAAARAEIDAYVNRKFGSRIPKDHVSQRSKRTVQVPLPCLRVPYLDHPACWRLDHLVQELEVVEVGPRCRAFSRHALRPQSGIRTGNHGWRQTAV